MKGFLTFLMVAALLLVGWYMGKEDYYFWDIVEAESHLLIWSLCFIFAFANDGGPLSWFPGSRASEKLKAILFLPVCVAICYYAGRYGGDFLMRCLYALLKWKPLDLQGELDVAQSVFGTFPDVLYKLGLAYSPIVWAIVSRLARSIPGWLLAAVCAALLGSLVGTLTYVIAFVLAVVIFVLIALALGFSNRKRRVFRDGRWQDEWL